MLVKFISVFGIVLVLGTLLTLLWPRFTDKPRPELLARAHDLLMTTMPGQKAANVLGVSDDRTVEPLTVQSILKEVTDSMKVRITDVVITHALRIITGKFKELPMQQQEKVILELNTAVSTASPSQEFSHPTQ